jgi:hypothetical protein
MYDLSGELTDTDHYLVVAKLGKNLQQVKNQHRSLMGKVLISVR